MDIAAIGVFVDVMRTGGFAAVARQRGADPSSISRTIAGLERQLGIRLFQRTTRRLTATEAGALFYERVAPLLEEMQRAELEARDVVEKPSGHLRVTASVAFGYARLVPLLPKLRSTHPDLTIELLLSDAMIDLVAEHVDVAVRLGPRMDSGLVGTLLMQTRYQVCASPAFLSKVGPLRRPDDLRALDCLLLSLPGFRSQWKFRDRRGAVTEVPLKSSIIMSNPLALHRAALDGLGPVLLPDWLVGEDIRRGQLADLFPRYRATATDFETGAWILYPSRAYMPRKVRAFIDFAKAEIPGDG